ncbi:hypothetical protein CHS0354_000272 [Potamilus streckersoni]|uniref:LEM domain-containing protein n=1 Tax=Potamilus streckersoni TaxID=2493646 RepID=A0AAE0VLI2_9BIVA|nr:hypothetical protein CHS0354_000272 [Potamilus streckersoni]
MADKLSDQELAEELKKYGEDVKVPIDYRKRPILVKKLNHYRAKENPPLKKNRGGGRKIGRTSAPHRNQEFSDESQDEESETKSIHEHVLRTVTPNIDKTPSSSTRTPTRASRSKGTKAGHIVSIANSSIQRGRRSLTSTHHELYADEFSDLDADTADESTYEVQDRSINTTLPLYHDDDRPADASFAASQTTKSIRRRSWLFSGRSNTHQENHINHASNIENEEGFKTKDDSVQMYRLRDQHISKGILVFVALFFVTLAMGYFWIARDRFISNGIQLAREKPIESEKPENDTDNTDLILEIISQLHDELAYHKGRYEMGELSSGETVRWSEERYKKFVENMISNGEHVEKMLEKIFTLILKHQDWNIRVYDEDGVEQQSWKNETRYQIEAALPYLTFFQRLSRSFYKIFMAFLLLITCLAIGCLGFYCLHRQNKIREAHQTEVYEMVEKIIELLKEASEQSERKHDPVNYPPYLAVQHVRDQLIPISKRRQLQNLWNDAVKFVEASESRIRVETQVIQGEQFTVWRWMQSVPNGRKHWQGQAFGVNSQYNSSLRYGPTPCLKVRNMFDTSVESDMDWEKDLEEVILEKCKNNNGILHIYVDRTSKEGCVYIKCSSCEKAYEAYQSLHGWWFDGRLVTAKYLRLERYHERFPESMNKRCPLQPSTSSMSTVSHPYYRSALEMT